MEKKWIIIAVIVIGILLGLILGIYTYHRGGISNTNMIDTQKLAEEDKEENRIDGVQENETIQTANITNKISPNAIIVEKKYYKTCDHLIRNTIDVPEELVNGTEENVQAKYPDWKIESYSPTEIVVYKEFAGICDEHYVVKEKNGIIAIYTENSEGVQEWKEDTDIATQYLPEEDLENLKVGIKIIGITNLYNFLEDYE